MKIDLKKAFFEKKDIFFASFETVWKVKQLNYLDISVFLGVTVFLLQNLFWTAHELWPNNPLLKINDCKGIQTYFWKLHF